MKSIEDLPEFVYLVTVDSAWPVSVMVAYGDESDGPHLNDLMESRQRSGTSTLQIRAWRARLTDIKPVDVQPERVIPASIVDIES